VRFKWIDQHRHQERWPAAAMCQVLGVSRSGYSAWSARQSCGNCDGAVSRRQMRHQELTRQVRLTYLRSRGTYGAPRITAQLKDAGVAICVNTTAKILRECALVPQRRRRFVPRTTNSAHRHPIAPNLLNRAFVAKRPDLAWLCDISYVHTAQGWLYLATVMDLCTRRIVGWGMADHLRAQLTCSALQMAIRRRRPQPGLIHHSDRGVQYACREYQQLLRRCGLIPSMSRRGDCYDNAPAESFFATLKRELLDGERHATYPTREDAKSAIFQFIETFYNRRRLHSSLGYKSPEQFEAQLSVSTKPAPTERG
jgi:putative transposase